MIALFTGVALLAAKPGPGMLTVASKAISEGLESVLFFMAGTNLVKILFFCLVVFGYQFIPDDIVFISIMLKSAASVYLIWLGIKGLQNSILICRGTSGSRPKPDFGIISAQGSC